ncbi:hypothetical protein EON65_54310 [archaeon]|nr:MAG: hypothetical protein EON65_54310 [archaeon]
MEHLERVLSLIPPVCDELLNIMKCPTIIAALCTNFDFAHVFDYVEVAKSKYEGMKLRKSELEKAKACVLAVYTAVYEHFFLLFTDDPSSYWAKQEQAARNTFGHIDIFQGLSDAEWREITIFYSKLKIMMMFMKKLNQRSMEHAAALFIGITSSLASGDPSKRVKRLRNVTKHVIGKETFTSRQRRDASFVPKRQCAKLRDYVRTAQDKVVTTKTKAFKSAQVVAKIKEEKSSSWERRMSVEDTIVYPGITLATTTEADDTNIAMLPICYYRPQFQPFSAMADDVSPAVDEFTKNASEVAQTVVFEVEKMNMLFEREGLSLSFEEAVEMNPECPEGELDVGYDEISEDQINELLEIKDYEFPNMVSF